MSSLRIAFGCQARVGKDTACNYLREKYGGSVHHFSDPLYLYSHISSFSENDIEAPIHDLSKALVVDRYAVGSRQIEVIHEGKRSFASVLSPKEYHNAGQDDLYGSVLQLPLEIIATEVFYPTSKKLSQRRLNVRIIF